MSNGSREWRWTPIHHGEPCITGTRIPVRIIVGSLADGLTVEQIVEEYPQLGAGDILAALAPQGFDLRQ